MSLLDSPVVQHRAPGVQTGLLSTSGRAFDLAEVVHGELVMAVVVHGSRRSISAKAPRSFCATRLADYTYPRETEFIAEAELPTTSSGQVAKNNLKRREADRSSSSSSSFPSPSSSVSAAAATAAPLGQSLLGFPRKKSPLARTSASTEMKEVSIGKARAENDDDIASHSNLMDQENEEREQAYIRQCVAVIKERDEREKSIALQADMTRAADERARQVGIGFAYYDVVHGREQPPSLASEFQRKEAKRGKNRKEKSRHRSRYVPSFELWQNGDALHLLQSSVCDVSEPFFGISPLRYTHTAPKQWAAGTGKRPSAQRKAWPLGTPC